MSSSGSALFRLHAQFCSVFSHETRLKIIWLLGGGERCVTDIASELGLTIQNVSQHLAVMRDKGAVTYRKCGQKVCYSIANPKFFEGFMLIRAGLIELYRKLGETSSSQEQAPPKGEVAGSRRRVARLRT
ncbi:MAG: helix-turn-helix transcriptional regulator [Verrucomicrobia bacterium]|nr:helix-turn-helix transcriptional regulator [Verrucomicrobiota bacterium]